MLVLKLVITSLVLTDKCRKVYQKNAENPNGNDLFNVE